MAEQANLTPELNPNQPKAQTQPQASSTNRIQRRFNLKQQGILKYISKLPYTGEIRTKLRAQNLENGRKIHQQNVERNEQINAQYLESVLEGLKETWASQGFNAEEIKTLEEAWSLTAVKDKDNYRADKKASKALYKEAKASRASRQK